MQGYCLRAAPIVMHGEHSERTDKNEVLATGRDDAERPLLLQFSRSIARGEFVQHERLQNGAGESLPRADSGPSSTDGYADQQTGCVFAQSASEAIVIGGIPDTRSIRPTRR